MIDYAFIGRQIKSVRKSNNLTQEKFAEQLQISTEHLSRIENGAFHPSLTLIEKICKSLNISEVELMFGIRDDDADHSEIIALWNTFNDSEKKSLIEIIKTIKSMK